MVHNHGAKVRCPAEPICCVFSLLCCYSSSDSQLLAPSQSTSEGKHCSLAVSAIKHRTREALAMLAVLASCLSPLLSSTVYESENSPHSISRQEEK